MHGAQVSCSSCYTRWAPCSSSSLDGAQLAWERSPPARLQRLWPTALPACTGRGLQGLVAAPSNRHKAGTYAVRVQDFSRLQRAVHTLEHCHAPLSLPSKVPHPSLAPLPRPCALYAQSSTQMRTELDAAHAQLHVLEQSCTRQEAELGAARTRLGVLQVGQGQDRGYGKGGGCEDGAGAYAHGGCFACAAAACTSSSPSASSAHHSSPLCGVVSAASPVCASPVCAQIAALHDGHTNVPGSALHIPTAWSTRAPAPTTPKTRKQTFLHAHVSTGVHIYTHTSARAFVHRRRWAP